MKNYKLTLTILLVLAMIFASVGIVAAETSMSQVEFIASEADSQGNFTLSLSIYNAKFNACQFVLRYDKNTVMPVNSAGGKTESFSSFARKIDGKDELSLVGTSIDSEKGLIDFTAYLSPGSYITSDGLPPIEGYANIGSSGVKIFEFKFKKTGDSKGFIEIASQSTSKPYSNFLPRGAALLDAGKSLPMSVKFHLPLSVGGNFPTDQTGPGSLIKPDEAKLMTKEERLEKTIVLQIGNYGSASDGSLTQIDLENKEVTPYIDENNRTMVPVRFIAEQLGASVYWNEKAKTVTIVSANKTIVMTVGSSSYRINDVIETMDTAPVIKKGWNRTMVPIRFVVEALDKAVEWDQTNSLVLITPLDEPWQFDRQAEQEATDSVLNLITYKNRRNTQ